MDSQRHVNQERIQSWRIKAEELRTLAERMTDIEARRGLLEAAASYDALADETEAHNQRRANRPS